MGALISIVMPLYNKRDYVVGAVRSCLHQTYPPLEIVVIDDGSTDGGPQLVAALGDPRIRIQSQANAGVAVARNAGIAQARGDFVCFVDADDVLRPQHLAEIAALAEDFPNAAMLATRHRKLLADGSTLRVPIGRRIARRGLISDFHREWSHGPFTFTSAIAARLTLLGAGRIQFPVGERWGEDQDVWFQLAEAGEVAYSPAETVLYRVEVDGSATSLEGRRSTVLPAYARLALRLAEQAVPEHLRRGARRLIGNHLLNVVQTRLMLEDIAGAQNLLADPMARQPLHRYLALRLQIAAHGWFARGGRSRRAKFNGLKLSGWRDMQDVAVLLKGGLGNQLFQYAAGRALADKHCCRLVLDVSWFNQLDPSTTTPRKFALTPFGLKLILRGEVQRVGANTVLVSSPLLRVAKKVKSLLSAIRLKLWGITVFREQGFAFDANLLEVKPPAEIHGFWQSEKYFQGIADQLRQELGQPRALSVASRQVLADIETSESICMHVRRGDYLTNQHAANLHGTCSPEYYVEGLRRVTRNLDSPKLFIFSDDPAWVRENLHFNVPRVVVDANGPDDAHQDLWLMAACQHFVIANSSLSWWGAWLGRQPGKRVVAPARWFASGALDTRDLIPSNWTLL